MSVNGAGWFFPEDPSTQKEGWAMCILWWESMVATMLWILLFPFSSVAFFCLKWIHKWYVCNYYRIRLYKLVTSKNKQLTTDTPGHQKINRLLTFRNSDSLFASSFAVGMANDPPGWNDTCWSIKRSVTFEFPSFIVWLQYVCIDTFKRTNIFSWKSSVGRKKYYVTCPLSRLLRRQSAVIPVY